MFFESFREREDIAEIGEREEYDFSREALDKYDEFMGDENLPERPDIPSYDDNGKIFRIGNNLLPNNEYEIHGYKYKTDEWGRPVSAEGKLHLKNHEGRLPIKDSLEDIGKGDQRESDDRGHLIGDQFDGSNGMENMIPQDAHINRNDFKNFENQLRKEVENNKDVYVEIEPIYEGKSRRPEAVVVTYSINREQNMRIFPNGEV